MDFAALMSAEISKSRPSPSKSSAAPPTPTPTEPPKRYLKRSDQEAQRQEAYLTEQSDIESARLTKLSQKRAFEASEAAHTTARDEKRRRLAEESRLRRAEEEERKERARRKRLGLPDLSPTSSTDSDEAKKLLKEGQEDIPEDDLRHKLRSMGEPAILFAETHAQRLRRYYILTTPKPTLTTGPIPTTLALLPESALKVPPKPPPPGPDRDHLYRQLASYFTLVLTEWAAALAARPASVADTFQGKQAYSAMTQSRENMRPLFRRFEKGSLEDGILEPVVEIVRAAQERRYVDANDGYLTLSIGKAAWPIGVTMVGIHERSAREKLHESDKGAAHIMSDEVTRKFLQSIKRCLSFAQTRWPPEDHLQLMG